MRRDGEDDINMAIGVWIVDDHEVVRDGLRLFVSSQPEVVVRGSSSSGDEVLAHLRVSTDAEKPDVVVLDHVTPGTDASAVIQELTGPTIGVAVLVISSFTDSERVRTALRAGASGYLDKSAGPDDVLEAIRTVHRGDAYLDGAIARRLHADEPPEEIHSTLTPREREILELVGEGLSNRQIAERLVITERTARSHVSNVLLKLGLPSRTMAALWVTGRRAAAADDGPRRR